MNGDHVDQSADTQSYLQRNEVDKASHTLAHILGHGVLNPASPRVGEQAKHGGESGHGQNAMVQLDERGVLKHVAPPEVRMVSLAAVEGIEELRLGRHVALAHLGELVVDETGIKTSDQGAGKNGGKNKAGKEEDRTTENLERR